MSLDCRVTNSPDWAQAIPRKRAYYWARRVLHNGPTRPFVVWVYTANFGGRTKNHWRMRSIDGLVVKDEEMKDGDFEVSCEPISCPISDLAPARNWIEYAKGND